MAAQKAQTQLTDSDVLKELQTMPKLTYKISLGLGIMNPIEERSLKIEAFNEAEAQESAKTIYRKTMMHLDKRLWKRKPLTIYSIEKE